MVQDSGNEVYSKAKAFASVAVALCQEAKNFEFTDGMFYYDPFLGDAAVICFLFLGQRFFLASLVRHLAFFMQLSDALIAAVGLQHHIGMQAGFAFFKEAEIVRSPLANNHANDFSFSRNDQLDFLSVSFLFARVIAPLLFLGRSTGDSPTSTKMILPSTAPVIFNKAFLPGRRNTPL